MCFDRLGAHIQDRRNLLGHRGIPFSLFGRQGSWVEGFSHTPALAVAERPVVGEVALVHAADPELMYASSVSGEIYRSTNGGVAWDKLPREFGEIRALAWTP